MNHKSKTIEEIEILKARPYLSKREFSILSGLSVPSITRHVLDGSIPHQRIGRRVLIINRAEG